MITNHFRRKLRFAASEKDMTTYLCERHNWTPAIIDKIDWEHLEIAQQKVFSAARSRFSRIIEFLHNIQNTGHQKRLFSKQQKGPEASDRCPMCMICEETTIHLYQCNAPELKSLADSGLHELEDSLEDSLRQRHMPSEMWTAFRMGITSFRDGTNMTWRSTDPVLQQAVEAQTVIGWGHFLKGFVATEWGEIMALRYAGSPNHRVESRRRFMTTLIMGLWDLYDSLWKKRCEKVHDDTDVNSLTAKELDRRIRYYFENKLNFFDSGDYDRFHLGLRHTLNMPISQRRAWIQTFIL